jgi:signal transduction histidine kinase
VLKESGVGLFVARLIIEAHGGEVHVDVPAGSQSVNIHVILPLFDPHNGPA